MVDMKQLFTKRNLYYGFLHIAVVALAAQVVVLTSQNKKLKESQPQSKKEQIKEGDQLAFGQLEPLRDARVDTSSSKQIVFVMTTTCQFCKQSVPMWNQLAATRNLSISIIGISLDDRERTIEYVKSNNILFPVFLSSDQEFFKNSSRVYSVPKTILRQSGGRVLKVWHRQFTESNLNEVANATSLAIIH